MNWEGDKTAIQETFERITEGKNKAPVKHLYRRQYETAGGDWRTVFYAIFTDWKGKRRKFPLRSELKAAKDGLTIYEACNIRCEEFDADKVNPNEGMTVASGPTGI